VKESAQVKKMIRVVQQHLSLARDLSEPIFYGGFEEIKRIAKCQKCPYNSFIYNKLLD
jgi:hypothetical protein